MPARLTCSRARPRARSVPRTTPFLVAMASLLAATTISCDDKPKVDRAGVTEPSPTPTQRTTSGADSGRDKTDTPARVEPSVAPSAAPSPSPSASPTSTGNGTNGAGNGAIGNGTVVDTSAAAGNAAVTTQARVEVPSPLTPATEDYGRHFTACQGGNAIGCMRAAAMARDDARKAGPGGKDHARAIELYMKACVKDGVVGNGSCKSATPPAPTEANGRGCYEAGLLMHAAQDPNAKVAFQCACDRGFELACDDAKAVGAGGATAPTSSSSSSSSSSTTSGGQRSVIPAASPRN